MTTTTTLQRLLKYPHSAVFEKSPAAELALRVRHDLGAKWSVADGQLSVAVAGTTWEYDLAQHTIGSLADALVADGFDIPFRASRYASYGALALVEGEGCQARSNGDHLSVFTSPLWAIMGGYAGEIREAEYQKDQALRQMVIWQSEGEWLDLWGALYSVARLDGESDEDYAARIPKEAFRIRVNGLAIEKAIKDYTGYDVEIREPWKWLFRLDESALSGAHHFPDGRYYSYFTIHPVARDGGVDWHRVLQIIHRNRAAGIDVYDPYVELPVRHVRAQPPAEYTAVAMVDSAYSVHVRAGGEAPLGEMRLDDNEFTLNHPAIIFGLLSLHNKDGLAMGGLHADILNRTFLLDQSRLAYTPEKIVSPRTVAMASVELSGESPLGHENSILSRGMVTSWTQPPASVSRDLQLSHYKAIKKHERVSRIIAVDRSAHLEFGDEYSASVNVSSYSTFSRHLRFHEPVIWSGGWDDRVWFEQRVMGSTVTTKAAGDVLNDTLVLNISIIS